MTQSIGQKFTPLSLLKFAMPSMVMMVFMSLYTIVDGIFVSRFAGSDALSAVNIVWPMGSVLLAVGIMLATGGSAVVARKLGEGKGQEARENFTMFVVIGLIASLLFLVVTAVFLEPICYLLGSDEVLLPYCKEYLLVIMAFGPACMLQSLYQCFFVTAGRPGLGLGLIISAGIANAILDYVFMGPLGWGVKGAAFATGIGQMIPAVLGTIYFLFVRKELYFVRFKIKVKDLMQACANGSSEMVTNLSNAVITFAFNLILMRMAGSDGVAAITIILYGQFLFSSLYLGFTMGVAPVVSYRFGAKRFDELRKLNEICRNFIIASSLVITVISFVGAPVIVETFVGVETKTYELTVSGFAIFSIAYLFTGFNIYASGLFTALSDGKNSAIISFCRTLVFILLSLLTLPALIGINGVWLAIPVAEFLTFFLAFGLCKKKLPM